MTAPALSRLAEDQPPQWPAEPAARYQPFGIPWHDDAADRIRESGIDEHFMLQFLLGYLAHSDEFRTAVDHVLAAFAPALAPVKTDTAHHCSLCGCFHDLQQPCPEGAS